MNTAVPCVIERMAVEKSDISAIGTSPIISCILFSAGFMPIMLPAPLVYIAYNIAEHFIWHQHLKRADRLKQIRGMPAFVIPSLKATSRRHFKGHFRRVHRMIRAVHQRLPLCPPSGSLPARPFAVQSRRPFSTAGKKFLGTAPPNTFSSNTSSSAIAGLKLNPYISELTVAARLLFVPALYLYRLSYSLAVSNFRLFKLNLRTEFGF